MPTMPLWCPFFPEEPREGIRCDYLIGKEASFKQDYVAKFCRGNFKDCTYYWHLMKWKERIKDAMKEEEEGL